MSSSELKSWLSDPGSPVRYFIYLGLLLPFFIFRDYTPPNELKYISIVEEALRNNTWFTFYNHGAEYADKPPLYFWLVMLSRLLTGGYHTWIIGMFSLLPALGVLAVMDRWILGDGTAPRPVVSNLLLLTTAMFTGAFMVIRMDMLMTFFIVLSLYTFYRIYKGENRPAEKYLLPVYLFLAIFSKGPMGFLLPVVSIYSFLAVKRSIRFAGRYFGWRQWAILVGLCGIWFLCVYLEGGREYLNNILVRQTIGRGIDSFHHKEPVWFYFPRMLWTFAPWVVVYIVLLWLGIRRKMFKTDIRKFFATVVISNIVLLSLVSSKLDIYMLPVYPFVVYLCSFLLHENSANLGVKIGVGIPAAIFALALPGFLIAGKYIPYDYTGILPYIGVTVLSLGGVAGMVWLFKRNVNKAIVSTAGSLLAAIFVFSFMFPQFNKYYGFGEMAQAAGEKSETEGIDRYAYYRFGTAQNMSAYLGEELLRVESVVELDSLARDDEKTIVFFRGKDIRRDDALRDWVAERQPEWAVGEYSWYVVGEEDCSERMR